MKKKKTVPNYKLIFLDILEKKYPHKKINCEAILNKKKLSQFDVLELNQRIFEKTDKDMAILNQKHKSYDNFTISEILSYQVKNKLTNTQVANHFKLSRNTVAKWKKNVADSKT